MKKLTFLLGIIFISNLIFAQKDLKEIANEVCVNLNKADFNKKPEIINQEAMNVIQSVYNENSNEIAKLAQDYA
ncbi:MAG: hypothetical protein M0P66_13405, partial [Salinivirgaceae bacterium]|nr:hypothetical protein [Salinivirgaceae bacterium]